ncbi:phage tail protein [Sphingomonas sp. RIT328]|uniref:phage tail protein n=1 Tax=Sphingomonas sp. RIT328 TaxID=1470591 RepID=UPI000448509E|nr:phage tail protein [Sphingomonas sp. RIT328]EZP57424.1 Phage tail protein [Sphingomonas sp. RIT328]
MGKVVATVGVIVGAVALAATGIGAIAAPALAGAVSIGGISASTLLFAGAALQAVGQALIKRPKLSGSTTDRLNASLVTDTPRKMVFGRTALNTDLRYQEWWGRDQEYCSQVFVVASHWCESIDEIWLDDKLAWSAAGGVTGEFAGYLGVAIHAQAVTGSTFNAGWSGRWGPNAAFAGCATLYLQFKVTGNGKKGKSPFSSTITSRVTVVGKGARLPDPRFDSTLGGAGAVRLADQTTWAWAPNGYESGRNPALALLFYLIGWRIQNPVTREWKLAVGRGVPIDRIDVESFITAANLCDEPVTRADGTTEPRYRCDGTFSEEDDPAQVIAGFEACMNGKLRDSTGRFALQVLHNDLATPVVDFTDDDVLGDFNWSAGNNLNDRRNVVRGRLTDPASLYQLVDFPAVRIASVDGIERIDSVDLALVQSPSQGQRLAKQRLQRAQYQGAFSAEFNARGWAVKDGDIVRLTFSALGFDRKLFRVSEGVIDPTGVVPLVLVEEHQAIYAWDRDERAAVQAAEPNEFNPLLLPIIVAIDEAGRTAEWPAIVGEGKPEDNATVGAVIGENFFTDVGDLVDPGEVLNSAVDLRPDGTLVVSIGDTVRPLGKINLIDLGAANDTARRQLEMDLASLSAAVAQLATGQAIVQNVFRDAGLYADPASGVAKLFAIESRAEQLSKLSVTLNAALSSIELKASVNYVNEAILQAKLDGSDIDLSSILVRLTSAEANVFGLQGAIQLKADATVVTGLQGSVTSINQSLDALKAVVETKVSQTVVDKMGVRLTLAEQTLNAFDGASLATTLTASRRFIPDGDVGGANDILATLAAFDAGQFALAAIATAKTELTAKTDTITSAIASLSLQLGVQIGAVNANVSRVQAAQIEGDQAIASDLATYKAATNGSLAQVNQVLVAQSGINTSVAGMVTSLTSTVAGNTNTLRVYGESIDGLSSKWGVEFNANGVITGFALNNGSGRTDAAFVVDTFKIAKANGSSATVVFAVADDGVIEMRSVRATNIAVGLDGEGERLKITNKLISGVKANGKLTFRLGSWG